MVRRSVEKTVAVDGGALVRGGVLAAAALLAAVLPAAADGDIYAATVIVTGRDNVAERARGIREALPLVLTKVSLDREAPLLAAEDGLLEDPERLVSEYAYRDRKEGIQISDEQGTRERSFEFTVRFHAHKIDALLMEVGVMPYHGQRPEIGVALTIEDGVSRYLLTQNSEQGYGQRLAFADTAKASGLPIRLPAGEDDNLDTPVRLGGTMTLTASGYWETEWQAGGPGGDERFALEATTFDVAIREALYRTVAVFGER